MTEEDEIKKFIAERGVTICAPQAAAVLGENTPGWRRNAEKRAEIGQKSNRRDRLQKELAARQEGQPLPFRGRGRTPLQKS